MITRRVEVALVLGVALAVCATLWRFTGVRNVPQEVPPERAEKRTPPTIDLEVGDRVCLPGQAGWATESGRVVIIVTSGVCPSCGSNRAFEERLYGRCKKKGIPVFYILAESTNQQARVSELKSQGRNVIQTDLPVLGFRRTPAIAAIDTHGVILAMWVGTVPATRENEIRETLVSGSGGQLCERIQRAELESRAASMASRQLVALAEPPNRLLFPGIKYQVIPAGELAVRAEYELRPEVATFVDCGTAKSAWECQEALLTLRAMGFGHLIAVDLPRRASGGNCGT